MLLAKTSNSFKIGGGNQNMEVKPYPGREEAKMLAKRLSGRPQGFSLWRSKKGLLQLAALEPLAKRSGEDPPTRLADPQLSRC